MITSKLLGCFLLIASFMHVSLLGRDILLEFKGAYFHATGSPFKEIYKGSALYGPELTVQLWENENWYGFAIVDYFRTKGHSVGLGTVTEISLLPIGIGVKYLVPIFCEKAHWYGGLGFQPVWVHIKNDSQFVVPKQTKWVFGGIAKLGTYIDLPNNFLLDLFIDYFFVRISSHAVPVPAGPVIPLSSSISGVVFGAGLGYRF